MAWCLLYVLIYPHQRTGMELKQIWFGVFNMEGEKVLIKKNRMLELCIY